MVFKVFSLIHPQLHRKVSSSRSTLLNWNPFSFNRKRLFKRIRLIINSLLLVLLLSLTTSVKKTEAGLSMKAVDPDGGVLEFAGAEIAIPAGAIQVKTPIWVERLNDSELPPLAPGMVNVTEGGGGYRFLPDGTVFDQPVSIKIPLEEGLVGDSPLGEAGVHTYYWDEERNLWVKLSKIGLDANKESLVSTTTHFTDMINAILTAPDNPSPLLFNPNSIKDIAAVDPTTGVELVEPPIANNQGSAELTHPIQIPAGRGAFSPQLALTYSSVRGNGWLGMGWNLTEPRIEVDTRWGVPAYDGSERFLLNGAAIVPIPKDSESTCKASTDEPTIEQFAPRNETFERIVKCITGDKEHWEITAKDGTRFEYGTDNESRLSSYRPDEKTHTAVWYLRRVIDPNDNITEYHYQTDSSEPSYQGESFVQKYLKQIVYTAHPDLPAAYKINLETDCKKRTDLIVSGRTGFKVVTRCRLTEIDVVFQDPGPPQTDRLIRRYILKYGDELTAPQEGAFGKSVLAKIITQGTDGSDFYEHAFEYTQPKFENLNSSTPFTNTNIYSVSQDPSNILPLPVSNRLLDHTSESSHSFGGGIGFGTKFQVGSAKVGCKAGASGKGTWESPEPEILDLDINGDRISDRVWLAGGQVRALLGQPEIGEYSSPYSSTGINSLGSEDAKGGMGGVRASCTAQLSPSVGVGASAGVSFSVREADANSLMTDVDGDGLADLALGASFYRGLPHHCRDGTPPNGTTGKCADGLSACPDENVLCFEHVNDLIKIASVPLPDTPAIASFADENAPIRRVGTAPAPDLDPATELDVSETDLLVSSVPLETVPPSSSDLIPQVNTEWGRYTAKRMRFEQEPHLQAEMYQINPVIRWDAWHDGTINVTVRARRKYLGGTDGARITLLKVTNPTISTGTQVLGKALLEPDSQEWINIFLERSIDIKFEESLLLVVDTVDDVPVDDWGNLIDEIDIEVHIEYKRVCPPPDQSCRELASEELAHRDATGQLSYVFDFPADLRISELPRDGYWQLLPPIGPPRENADGNVDQNRVVGVAHKVAETETPVYVRVRCESLQSQQANDNTTCPLGTVLAEHVFAPGEIGEAPIEVDLPSPWLEVDKELSDDDPVAVISNRIEAKTYADLNKPEITIWAPSEELEMLVKEFFPQAQVERKSPNVEVALITMINGLEAGHIDAIVDEYGILSKQLTLPPLEPPLSPSLTLGDVGYICCTGKRPQSFIERGPTYLFDPVRLLFEIDGENGAEVPPETVTWNPAIDIVSIHDMEEVRGLSSDTPVVLVSRKTELGRKVLTFDDLNQPGAEITYQNNPNDFALVDMAYRRFDQATFSSPLPTNTEDQFRAEAGLLGLQVYRVSTGFYDGLVAEYGSLQQTMAELPDILADTLLVNLEPAEISKDLAENTFFCCQKGHPLPIYGSLRALVRDTADQPLYIYDYSDLNRTDITVTFQTGSMAELALESWSEAVKEGFPTVEQALDAVVQGKANALIADAEFIETAIADPDIAAKAFVCCHRGNLHDMNTEVVYLRQGPPVFIDPDAPWHDQPRVLYRVHPSRQLIPFYNPTDNQELRVQATIVNPHKPLIVTVTGDSVEGELEHLVLTPEDAEKIVIKAKPEDPVVLVGSSSPYKRFSDLNQPDVTIVAPSDPMEKMARQSFPRAKILNLSDELGPTAIYFYLIDAFWHEKIDAYIDEYGTLSKLMNPSTPGFFVPTQHFLPTDLLRLARVASFCCPRGQPRSLTQPVAATQSFTVQLPKAGFYYVRGFTEASFDPTTSITVTAEMVEPQAYPFLALVNKNKERDLRTQSGLYIQTYSDLNDPLVTIAFEQGSLAETVIKNRFPHATRLPSNSKEDALSAMLGSDALVIIAEAAFIQAQLSNVQVMNTAFSCCPRGFALPLITDIPVPTNLIKAKFGGGHRGQQLTIDARDEMEKLEVKMIGEVPYSQDPWGGGHHGFFYGQVRGDAELACIGPYPCEDRSFSSPDKPGVFAPLTDDPTIVQDPAITELAGLSLPPPTLTTRQSVMLAHAVSLDEAPAEIRSSLGRHSRILIEPRPAGEAATMLSISQSNTAGLYLQPITFQSLPGYLVLVRNRAPGESSIEEYSDLNRPNIVISVPVDTPASSIAQEFFPRAQISGFVFPDIVSEALALAMGQGNSDALLANAEVLQKIRAAMPVLEENTYLCCSQEQMYPLRTCLADSDGDGVPDCADLAPTVPEDIDGFEDYDGRPEAADNPRGDCKQDTDGDGIPDCDDPESDIPPTGCDQDTDGDGILNCVDRCSFMAGIEENGGCPSSKDKLAPKPIPCPPTDDIDFSPDSCTGKFLTLFSPLDGGAFGDRNCFTGSDPIAHICTNGTHATRNNSTSSSRDGEVDGALRRTQSFGLGADVGATISGSVLTLGINANMGVSSIYTELEYMDWNGDGLPDVISPNTIELTGREEEMIDLGLTCQLPPIIDPASGEEQCLSYPGIRESRNPTMGLAMNLGGGHRFQIKTTSGGRAKELGWANVESGIGIHAQTSMSSMMSNRFDINGDGLPDLVIAKHENGVERLSVRLNLGYRLGELEDWGETSLGSSGITGALGTVFDQALTDEAFERSLSRTQNLSTGMSVGGGGGLHLGGIFGVSGSFGRSEDVTIAETPLTFADLNGDGLSDFVLKHPDTQQIYIRFNQGGRLGQVASAFRNMEPFDVPIWQHNPIIPDPNTGPFDGVAKWINEALQEPPDGLNVSGGDTGTWAGTAEFCVFFVCPTASYHYTSGHSFVEMGLYDVTGDGLPDRVLRSGEETSTAAVQVQENLFGGANLLKIIHRPLGGRIILNYEQSMPSEADPNARWRLTSYTLKNEEDFPTEYKTTARSEFFVYEEPYYDRYEREFFGFELVRSTRGDGRAVETAYENRDYRLKGLIKTTKIFDQDGNLYTETENMYEKVRMHAENEQTLRQSCLSQLLLPLRRLGNDVLDQEGNTPCDVWFAKPTQTITRWSEGGNSIKQTVLHFEAYDEFGNALQIRDEQGEDPVDDLVATITYEHQPLAATAISAHQAALLEAHIVDRIKSIDVRQESISGTALRFREGAYDDRGNLIKHETYADPAGKKVSMLDIAYDSTGFTKAITDTAGYRVDYTPDGIVNLLAKEMKDSFGLSSTAQYDFRFQLPTEQIDVNGQKQITAYDVYGRLRQVQGPYELAAGKASLSVDYADLMSSFPAHVATTNLAVIPGSNTTTTTIRIATFVDGLGREIQTQADGEVDGKVGRIISGNVEFDSVGRLSTQGQPVFKSGIVVDMQIEDISNVAVYPGTGRITQWDYDVLDRITKITEPGNRISTATHDISEHPRMSDFVTRRSTIRDPEGKIRYEHRDAADRLVAVAQVLDGRELVTSYEYQPTGELTAITDALNHVTTLEHDLVGQRTVITTPDTGRLELGYDANGNLVEKTDQALCSHNTDLLQTCTNDEKILYEYDKNRLVLIDYPDHESTDVQFIYGDHSALGECTGQNTQGRVCKTIDGSGSEQASYGALGEVIRQTRVMRGAAWETEERTFVTEFVYDSFGRLLSMVYPDGETLTYSYDSGGQVKSVTGQKDTDSTDYVKNIQYDEFGQRSLLAYGNGVETTFIYEPDTHRLGIETINSPTVIDPLRTINYDYDKVGNIKKVTDVRIETTPFLKQANRVYSYDDLHRVDTYTLTAQEADATSQPIVVTAGYDYDDVGNITSQKIVRQQGTTPLVDYPSRDWTYQYGNANRPNLPDSLGPVSVPFTYSFTYDERGSILTMTRHSNSDAPPGATYTWDEEGRLRSSVRHGISPPVTQYAYNAAGQRTRKETNPPSLGSDDLSDTTIYPNEFYTARFARTAMDTCISPPCREQIISRSKHIHVDGQRLAVTAAVVDSTSADNKEDKLTFLATVPHYFHSDTVGSTTLLSDKDGKRAQEVDYLPFGEVLFENQRPGNSGLPQTFRFDGKELDLETGLQYFGARYYDPRLGRWISADPLYRVDPEIGLQNPVDLALFVFGRNNPIRYFDLDGRALPEHVCKGRSPSQCGLEFSLSVTPGGVVLAGGARVGAGLIGRLVTWLFGSGTGPAATTLPGQAAVKAAAVQATKRVLVGAATHTVAKALTSSKSIEGGQQGRHKTLREALDEAFERTGVPKSEFEITKWGRDEHGKSFPVEWRHKSGAEVSIDLPHTKEGPKAPHVGWQTGGKRKSGGAERGHIFLDDVPYNRPPREEQ